MEIQTTSSLATAFTTASAAFVSATTPVDPADPIETATYRVLAPVTNQTPLFARLQ